MPPSRSAVGRVLALYGVLVLFGLGIHYDATNGEPLGVVFVVCALAAAPFLVLDHSAEGIALLHCKIVTYDEQ